MSQTILRVIAGILMLGWMILIFVFSAQPASQSEVVSGTVAYRIVTFADEIFNGNLTEAEKKDYAVKIDYPVRKAAHMTEYAILGLFCVIFYGTFQRVGRYGEIFSLLTAFVYACADEFHQLFVPGRAGLFSDVLIDTAGAFLFLVILFVIKLAKNAHIRYNKK